jgi:hypothetical protein
MRRNRIPIPYPADVIAEVDRIVGPEKRAGFLVDLARRELKRQRLLKFFERTEPVWKPEDHPDIDDAGEWVREMRRGRRVSSGEPARTCLDVAIDLGVVGTAEDLPSDLSTDKKHFKGFGKG